MLLLLLSSSSSMVKSLVVSNIVGRCCCCCCCSLGWDCSWEMISSVEFALLVLLLCLRGENEWVICDGDGGGEASAMWYDDVVNGPCCNNFGGDSHNVVDVDGGGCVRFWSLSSNPSLIPLLLSIFLSTARAQSSSFVSASRVSDYNYRYYRMKPR